MPGHLADRAVAGMAADRLLELLGRDVDPVQQKRAARPECSGRQIVQAEVGAFLDRVDTLRPDVALFLVDTQLRMKDKLVPMFDVEVARRRLGWELRRLEREIWRVGPDVYLLNTDPDLVRNVGACLAAHFRARGIAVRPPSAPSSE